VTPDALATGLVSEDAPHGLGGGKEMCAVSKLWFSFADQTNRSQASCIALVTKPLQINGAGEGNRKKGKPDLANNMAPPAGRSFARGVY